MRRIVCLLLVVVLVGWSQVTYAAAFDFNVNINISRQNDGTTCGELWYNNQVVWRIAILADGAKPVSGGSASNTVFVVPDVVNGMFMIKVDKQ